MTAILITMARPSLKRDLSCDLSSQLLHCLSQPAHFPCHIANRMIFKKISLIRVFQGLPILLRMKCHSLKIHAIFSVVSFPVHRPLICCPSATLTLLLFQDHIRPVPTSGPLHLHFPGMSLPRLSMAHPLTLFWSLLRWYLPSEAFHYTLFQ